MEYVKGVPYFVAENEKIKAYPYLDADVSCEILIIGGGVDGAVANYFLSPLYDVVLVESSRLGFGATSLATSLPMTETAHCLIWPISEESRYARARSTDPLQTSRATRAW